MDAVKVKVKELCEAIVDSDEFKAMTKAEKILEADEEAKDVITQLTSVQAKIQQALQQGQEPDQADLNKVAELEKEMAGDTTIITYMRANEDFNELLEIIKNMINLNIQNASK